MSTTPGLTSGCEELDILPQELLRRSRRQRGRRGELLFRAGDRPQWLYFLISGEVRLVRLSAAGGELVLQRTSHGFFAEASLDSRRYHCDARFARASELVALPLSGFRAALELPSVRDAWIALLAGEIRRLRGQSERLSLNSTAERILHYLECEGRNGAISLGGSRKEWAQELGVSHESLYRTLAALQRAGRIRVEGRRISLVVPADS